MRHIGNSGLSPFELYECLVLLVKHKIQISMNWKMKRGRTWYSLHANCNQLCVYFKAISVDMVGIISNKKTGNENIRKVKNNNYDVISQILQFSCILICMTSSMTSQID